MKVWPAVAWSEGHLRQKHHRQMDRWINKQIFYRKIKKIIIWISHCDFQRQTPKVHDERGDVVEWRKGKWKRLNGCGRNVAHFRRTERQNEMENTRIVWRRPFVSSRIRFEKKRNQIKCVRILCVCFMLWVATNKYSRRQTTTKKVQREEKVLGFAYRTTEKQPRRRRKNVSGSKYDKNR